jgi:hypothetical protein
MQRVKWRGPAHEVGAAVAARTGCRLAALDLQVYDPYTKAYVSVVVSAEGWLVPAEPATNTYGKELCATTTTATTTRGGTKDAEASRNCSSRPVTPSWGRIWRIRATLHPPPRSDAPLLALPGRAFGARAPSGLQIRERYNQPDATAFTVWDGGLWLARYLRARPATVQGQQVLELGAGCGWVGLTAATLGAHHVTLTDLPLALPLLRQNIQANRALWQDAGCRDVVGRCLDWCQPAPLTPPQGGWDVVLLADCVWTRNLVAPLLATLAALLVAQPSVHPWTLLLSYQRRGQPAHEAFWQGLSKLFAVQEVTLPTASDDIHHVTVGVSSNPPLRLYRCTPRERQGGIS